ncbi:MAG: DUF2852 domain-containing protein [Rhizobiales bacterium]|nr:DUF2852 domain-containing protein [Hyphomicrobiales bacterium]
MNTTTAEPVACGSKRKWSALELAVMIGGFIVFWPIGLAALALKLIRGEMWPGAAQSDSPWTAYKAWREKAGEKPFTMPQWNTQSSSGNAAFDAYKREQLERLEAERRRLEDEQKAFGEYLARLRKAKDQDEFDRFMAERTQPQV